MMYNSINIYWANSFFSEADRNYNDYCVNKLREIGCTVFLPQEFIVNKNKSSNSKDIFLFDSLTILKSDIVVACIDQETIDCGVACEIGFANAIAKPIIGIYTDIRQNRTGSGRMYKNIYVIGAIEYCGEIVKNIDELIKIIPKYKSKIDAHSTLKIYQTEIVEHYNKKAHEFPSFINQLESLYSPKWSVKIEIDKLVKEIKCNTILEVGCGDGSICNHLHKIIPGLYYIGYDISPEMINIAKEKNSRWQCYFTDRIDEVSNLENHSFDLTMTLFTLHDQIDKDETFSLLFNYTRDTGYIVIVDLTDQDLPLLTKKLQCEMVRPSNYYEPRIKPEFIMKMVKKHNLQIIKLEYVILDISFYTNELLDLYLEFFGIYQGMDLPLGLESMDELINRSMIQKIISEWEYPFIDLRVFLVCILKK